MSRVQASYFVAKSLTKIRKQHKQLFSPVFVLQEIGISSQRSTINYQVPSTVLRYRSDDVTQTSCGHVHQDSVDMHKQKLSRKLFYNTICRDVADLDRVVNKG